MGRRSIAQNRLPPFIPLSVPAGFHGTPQVVAQTVKNDTATRVCPLDWGTGHRAAQVPAVESVYPPFTVALTTVSFYTAWRDWALPEVHTGKHDSDPGM